MWLPLFLFASADPRSAELRLVESALGSNQGVEWVRQLSDEVGARFAGSKSADIAVQWVEKTARGMGLTAKRESVKVPRWIRGEARAEVTVPTTHHLQVLALGGSVATPTAGLLADVMVVHSFDELDKRAAEAKGKIVLFHVQMERTKDFSGYGNAYAYRARGASAAAKHGAVASLIRSIGTGSHQLPHTGGMRYADGVTKIPSAALSHEDADLLMRLSERPDGDKPARVQLRLILTPRTEPDVESANVLIDLPGTDLASEVVLAGCHLDSWDVGRGALDDASGCSMLLELARLVQRDGLKPRRTIRLAFFMNEEFGLSGGIAYAKQHKAELAKHVLALEADAGAGRAIGYAVTGDETSMAVIRKWMAPYAWLAPLTVRTVDETGADLIPLHAGLVPQAGVLQDATDYFDWHHTVGDTFDKVVREDLANATAAFIALTWRAANDDATLERTKPAPE